MTTATRGRLRGSNFSETSAVSKCVRSASSNKNNIKKIGTLFGCKLMQGCPKGPKFLAQIFLISFSNDHILSIFWGGFAKTAEKWEISPFLGIHFISKDFWLK